MRLEHVVFREKKTAEDAAKLGVVRSRSHLRQIVDDGRFGVERLVLILREIIRRHVVAEHVFACGDRLLARQQLDEGGLPRPVDADQRDAIAALDGERRAGEHVLFAIALRHISELRDNPSAGLRLRETKMDGLLVRRNFDALDLLEFLDAALHLFGFGRLRAEPVDERFELLDPVALVGVGGFQLRAAFGLLLFVFRISAGVELDALVPDLRDARNGHIEEEAVVRNQHECIRDTFRDTIRASFALRDRGGWSARRAAEDSALRAAVSPARCASASRRKILPRGAASLRAGIRGP